MPDGYLVQLGDTSLDPNDQIVDPLTTFTTDTLLGPGQWTWSGTWSDSTYTNEIEPGFYHLGTDGNVYFVPDYGPVTEITSATVLTAPTYSTLDGIVEGTAGDDDIDSSYGDDPDGDMIDNGDGTGPLGQQDLVDAGAGNDSVQAGSGDDTVFGGSGSDTILGEDGDDVIHGDSNLADVTSESLNWDAAAADEADISAGFTQTTGNIEVDVSFSNDGNSTGITVESTSTVYVAPDEDFNNTSSLSLTGNGLGATSTTTMDFSSTSLDYLDAVSDVSFRINDIDMSSGSWQDIITIHAYDLEGNLVPVTITPAGNDTVSGNTITGQSTSDSPTQAQGSALVEIEGPVSQVVIEYANGDVAGQALWVTDVHFNTIPDAQTGDGDVIDGGAGADTIYGEAGDDTISGGADGDLIFGGLGNDSIDGGTGDDTIFGLSGNDTLNGEAGDDLIFGGTGADSLSGGTGSDTMYGGDGADDFLVAQGDTASGGDGDDTFVITDLSELDTNDITIIGGEGNETGGDTLNWNGLADKSTLVIDDDPDDANGGLSGSFELLDGTVVNFENIENIVCFTPGTRILTEQGERPIETLKVGDLVLTKDEGLQPIRWIGGRTVDGSGKFAPIAIQPHVTVGATSPLLVSPQHRILIQDWRAELLFSEPEVLVAAKHLVNERDAFVMPGARVTYLHLMFDRHQVIFAEGAPTESFHAADLSMSALGEQSLASMLEAFPELAGDIPAYGPTARKCLKRHEAALLLPANRGRAPLQAPRVPQATGRRA